MHNEKTLVCSVCGVKYTAIYEPKTPRCPECKAQRKAALNREYLAKRRAGGKSQREIQRITAENDKLSALAAEAAAHHMSYGKYVEARRAGTV